VLSPSTEGYDRGEKFAHYRTLDNLREYVLISQDKRRIERFVRQADGQWLLSITEDGSVDLAAIGCTLSIDDVYDKVEF
jgi:Uma2 family endonuclease